MSVADNLARIRETIGSAPIKLIAVTKNIEPAKVEEAYRCGVTEFGENRVQDALRKQEQLSGSINEANWHFIGHLQTNKARQAVGKFALIHSVDSLRLARELSKAATAANVVQNVLLQVKIAEDPNKSGFSVDELRADFAEIAQLSGLNLQGLMTIAPLTADSGVWRQCFSGLKALRDELAQRHQVKLDELSMGMSQDWQ